MFGSYTIPASGFSRKLLLDVVGPTKKWGWVWSSKYRLVLGTEYPGSSAQSGGINQHLTGAGDAGRLILTLNAGDPISND